MRLRSAALGSNPGRGFTTRSEMYELALFAGAGGGLLATKWLLGWRCVCAVEKAPYRREVLLRRQRDGLLDLFPIWDDIRTFTKRNNACRRAIKAIRRCRPLVVTAGFPCQPFSVAGKRDWETSEKNLWPETARVIQEVRPDCVLLENVPGIRPYLPVVIRDLRRAGFIPRRPTTVAAASVGAGHIRKRVWIFAYAQPLRRRTRSGRPEPTGQRRTESAGCAESIFAHRDDVRQLQQKRGVENLRRRAGNGIAKEGARIRLFAHTEQPRLEGCG